MGKSKRRFQPKIKSAGKASAMNTDMLRQRWPLIAAVVAVVAVAAVAAFVLMQAPKNPDTGPDLPETGDFGEPDAGPPAPGQPAVSLQQYIDDYMTYADTQVTLTGYLMSRIQSGSGSGTMGVYIYYLTDDYGNEISLTGLTEKQKSLFVKGGTTTGLFSVTGTVRTKYAGFDLQVSAISAAG